MDAHDDDYLKQCLRKCRTLPCGGIEIPVSWKKVAIHTFWTALFIALFAYACIVLGNDFMLLLMVLLLIIGPVSLGFLWRLITSLPPTGITIDDRGITLKARKAMELVTWEEISAAGTRDQDVARRTSSFGGKGKMVKNMWLVLMTWSWDRGNIITLIQRGCDLTKSTILVNPLFLAPAPAETTYILLSILCVKRPDLAEASDDAAPDDKGQASELFEVEMPASPPDVAAIPQDSVPDDAISRAKARILGGEYLKNGLNRKWE